MQNFKMSYSSRLLGYFPKSRWHADCFLYFDTFKANSNMPLKQIQYDNHARIVKVKNLKLQ